MPDESRLEELVEVKVVMKRLEDLMKECEAADQGDPTTLPIVNGFKPFPVFSAIPSKPERRVYRDTRICTCKRLKEDLVWWWARCDYMSKRDLEELNPRVIIEGLSQRGALMPDIYLPGFYWFTWLYLPQFFCHNEE